jgi:addiction module HigA family antidote
MYDPAHPGEIVREECLKPLGLIVTAAAEALGVTRKALSDLLNGHTVVSPISLSLLSGGLKPGPSCCGERDALSSAGPK